MFGHLPELFIILVIALIVFGPEKLPEVAANAGRVVREMRAIADEVMNPVTEVPDDFSTYYYESLARSGEEVPSLDEEEFHDENHISGVELESDTPEDPVTDETQVVADSAAVGMNGGSHPVAQGEIPRHDEHSGGEA